MKHPTISPKKKRQNSKAIYEPEAYN